MMDIDSWNLLGYHLNTWPLQYSWVPLARMELQWSPSVTAKNIHLRVLGGCEEVGQKSSPKTNNMAPTTQRSFFSLLHIKQKLSDLLG